MMVFDNLLPGLHASAASGQVADVLGTGFVHGMGFIICYLFRMKNNCDFVD
jgi:hypothetical protein